MAKAAKVKAPERQPAHQKIANILTELLGVDDERITPEATLVQDLGADSLDIVELVMALEEEFGIVIDDAEVDNGQVQTVQQVFDLMDRKSKKRK